MMFRIKELIEKKGINMMQAAQLLGMPYTTYVNYEKGLREPNSEVLIQLANFYATSVDYIVGRGAWDTIAEQPDLPLPGNIIPMPEMRKIPLIGSIACGAPILAEEHVEEYIHIPRHTHADFALSCKGDSMINARIFDGDVVYISQQNTVENGEIAAVLIDGEATLKRVQLFEDHISLEPENPQYRPLVYWNEEMNAVRILGKAVAFTSSIR
jgi:repressor LexA